MVPLRGAIWGRRLVAAFVMTVPLALALASVGSAGRTPGRLAVAGDVIVNGSFESPVIPEGTVRYFRSLPGWDLAYGPSQGIELQRRVVGSPAVGDQHVELDSYGSCGIRQTVATQPGREYELSFFFSPRPGTPTADNVLGIKWEGGQFDTLSADGSGLTDTRWTRYSYLVSATGASARVEFDDLGVSNGVGTYLDGVSLVPVGDLALGALPAAALGKPYDERIDVTEGTAPYRFSVSDGAVPAGLTLSSAGRLSGTPTTAGASTFTVQAKDSSSPAKLGWKTYSVGVFDLASVLLRVDLPVKAGVAFTVTATAFDSAGRVLHGFDAAASWSDLSGALSPAAPASFVDGVSRTTATIAAPFHQDSLTVSSLGVTDSTGFNVYGPLASIAVSVWAHSGPASAASSGESLLVKQGTELLVRAVADDAAGNRLRDYQGPLAWSSLDGALSPSEPNGFVDGASSSRARIRAPFQADRITFTSGAISGQSDPFTVAGPFAAIRLRITTPISHGVPFQLKALAVDALGSTVPNYKGTASWTSLDGGLTPATPSPFANGVSATTATIPSVFANDRITLSSGGISGKTSVFNVH